MMLYCAAPERRSCRAKTTKQEEIKGKKLSRKKMSHIVLQTQSERFESKIAKLQEEKDTDIAKVQEEKDADIAKAHKEKDSVIAKAQEEKNSATAKLEEEHTKSTTLLIRKYDDELKDLKSTVGAREWQIKELNESGVRMTQELDCMEFELQDAKDELANTMAQLKEAKDELEKMPNPQGQWTGWKTVFRTHLGRVSTRACKNKDVGDPSHTIMGTGRLIVKEMLDGGELRRACQIINDNNDLKFESMVPLKKVAEYFCFHEDESNSMIWDAYDTSPMAHSTGFAQYCPFFIRFNDGPQMFSTLLWILGGWTDYELVTEFLKGPGGLFNRTLYEDGDAMDAEGEDYVKNCHRPLTEEDEEEVYGGVSEESQAY